VSRTIYLSGIAWALLLGVQVHLGNAASSDIASVGMDDARLTQLAQKLAAPGSDPRKADADTPGLIPAPSIVGTPLLRRDPVTDTADPGPDRVDTSSGLLKTVTSLGVVIGLILLARFGYARMGGKVASASSPVVEVLSRTTVAPRSHVMLLRVGGRVLVVSDSSAGMRTLASVEDAQEVADLLGAVSAAKPTSISRGFAQIFHRFDEEYESPQPEIEGDVKPGSDMPHARATLSGLLSKVRGLGGEGGAR